MTLGEAAAAGISKVRKSVWANPHDHLVLTLVNGGMGPWGTLMVNGAPHPEPLLVVMDEDTDWQEYTEL